MITSKSQLAEYCLRALGKPVINIEIDETQISDRIDQAIGKFILRHFDGVTETMYKHTISLDDVENGYITLPQNMVAVLALLKSDKSTSIEVFDDIEYNIMWDVVLYQGGFWTMSDYYINMRHISLINYMLSSDHLFEYNTITKQLHPKYSINISSSGNYLKSSTDLSITDDWTATNATLTANDTELVNDKELGDTVTSDAAGVFGFEQEVISKKYVRGVFTESIELLAGTYSGKVIFTMEDGNGLVIASESIQLTDQWTKHRISEMFGTDAGENIVFRVVTETAATGANETFHVYNPYIYKNNFIVVHGYQMIDYENFDNFWNNEWLKRYTTALLKKQHGTNTKKYSGVQLPGGVEIDGQKIFDEAVEELAQLDEEYSLTYELPLAMRWE